MKNKQMTQTTTKTLTERVEAHWNNCLAVNSSWVEFTNELGTLNLLGYLEDCNYDFVVDLLLDTDEFVGEDPGALSNAVGEFLEPLKTIPHLVFTADLEMVMSETGCDAEEIAGFAEDAGVSDLEILDFLKNNQ